MKSALLRTTIALFVSLYTSCSVEQISPKPKPLANSGLQQVLNPLVIGISDDDSPLNRSRASDLKRSLSDSHLFKKVALMSELNERPDLVIDSYDKAGSSFPRGFNCYEPLLYLLSAGVIPSVCEMDLEFAFTLKRPNHGSLKIGPNRFKERSVMGWIALPMALSPNWEVGHQWKEEQALTRDMWLTILEPRKREIVSLLR